MLKFHCSILCFFLSVQGICQDQSEIWPSVGFYKDSARIHSNAFLAQSHIFLPIEKPSSWHLGRDIRRRRIQSYSVRVFSADSVIFSKENIEGEKFPPDLLEVVTRF